MNNLLDLRALCSEFPLVAQLQAQKQIVWFNEKRNPSAPIEMMSLLRVQEAEQRLKRFSSYIIEAFPETKQSAGMIESELKEIVHMKKWLDEQAVPIKGRLLLKCDHDLPISGSIKARGGIYEVLKHAETVALAAGKLTKQESYAVLNQASMRDVFSQYKIAVGSTGNLGLSIGIMSAKLGFQVTVHMSADAKEWKKAMLRELGVQVIEYEQDYSVAVAKGRRQAEQDPSCHFIDDENSQDLFVGYAVAALRLQEQLAAQQITIDAEHPLFVYLPCGVGGGPGGVAYGLQQLFGEHVHIFFGEPLQSPCMLLGMMTGLHDEISVTNIGLTNETEADGLAVGRPSGFVGRVMDTILSGCYTVADAFLFRSLRAMVEREHLFMEPSAHAAMLGPVQLMQHGQSYMEKHGLCDKMEQAVHIVWSTGGGMVPSHIRDTYLQMEK